MRVSEEGFAAIGGPLHRPAHFARRPQADDLFRIDEDLGAEAATDVGRDHPQFVLGRDTDEGGDDEPRHVRVLRGVPQRQVVGAGVIFGQRHPRLDGVRNQPVVDDVQGGDVLGLGKGRFHRLLVAERPFVDGVLGRDLVDLRARFSLGRINHRREHLVIDHHLLGGVAAQRLGFGNHHRHRVADMVHRLGGDRRMRRHLHRRAVLGMDHPAADQTADLVGRKLRAGEHVDHAGHGLGRADVDLLDLGARVRRAYEHGAGFARPDHVVGISAVSGDEANVFLTAYRRADPGRAHGGVLPVCCERRFLFGRLLRRSFFLDDLRIRPWPWRRRRSP